MKPERRPIDPDPNVLPRKYPDENKWLWDMYELLETKLKEAV
jgi:dynein heavy chain